jgi:thiol-disulfide isomerase/thioredoxin
MSKARVIMGLVGSCLLWASAVPAWGAPPSVAQMLQFRPHQPGIQCSTPAPEEFGKCQVKLVTGSRPGSSGWLLVDANGQPLRRFFDSNGDKHIDVWSYYKDGDEIYREIDTNFNDKPDQYRWLNSGGMKWGVDLNEDGKIDAWKMISADEVAQEIFQAAADHDLARLQALFLTEADMRYLKMSSAKAGKLRATLGDAPAKFQATIAKLPNLTDKARFDHAEGGPPHCIPHEIAGTEEDLIMFPARSILFIGNDQKPDWLQTGEMIKVGMAWRLLDAPSNQDKGGTTPSPQQSTDKELQDLLAQISTMDAKQPTAPATQEPNAEMVRFNLDRALLVEKVLPRIKDKGERETWYKQLFDNLSTAAQYSEAKDARAMTRLSQLRKQTEDSMPGSNLAAYGAFRQMFADYTVKIATGKNMPEIQNEWLDQLAKFVQTYPNSEDTADALHQLAQGCEFAGRDEMAKRCYHQLATTFKDHPLAAKAAGAKRRLELVGTEIELQGPMLKGGSNFDIHSLKGKVVAVYYWASSCPNCVTDFALLKQLHQKQSAKGFEVVMVNLDDTAEAAQRYLQSNPVPGIHLFQATKDASGLSSPLAIQYGIQGLPTLFLVGRDGKVLNRTLQMIDLEDAVKKAQ